MGCTMHAHIEVKKDGRWLHFGAPNVERNYVLFALTNGERIDCIPDRFLGLVSPKASGKELPKDMSEVTAFCYAQDKKGYHLHGEGYLTAEDLRKLESSVRELGLGDLEENIFKTYIGDSTIASCPGWDDVRIIFWYDN